MNLWTAANELDELACDLSNVRNVIELVAEDIASPYSGALWAVNDMIEKIETKVAEQAQKVMELYRADLMKAEIKPKKTKK